jgi:hypothetical protein
LNNIGTNNDIIKVKRTEKNILPTEVTKIDDPLPTTMGEGSVGRNDRTEVKLPALEVVLLEAPKSATQSVTAGGTIIVLWKE